MKTLFLALACVLFIGCGGDEPTVYKSPLGPQNALQLGNESGTDKAISITVPIEMKSGQFVVLINFDDLGKWVANNTSSTIVTMTPEVYRSGYNTGKLIIVYSKPKAEK